MDSEDIITQPTRYKTKEEDCSVNIGHDFPIHNWQTNFLGQNLSWIPDLDSVLHYKAL